MNSIRSKTFSNNIPVKPALESSRRSVCLTSKSSKTVSFGDGSVFKYMGECLKAAATNRDNGLKALADWFKNIF